MQKVFYSIIMISIIIGCAGTQQPNKKPTAVSDSKIEKLKNNVKENPDDYRAYFKLGQMVSLKGDTTQAINYLDSALTLRSDFSEARFAKGKLLFKQNNVNDAFGEFLTLLEKDNTASWTEKIGALIGYMYPITQVTKGEYDAANPCYSPSGEKIVFQSNQNRNWDIFLMDRDGDNLVQLTHSPLHDEAPVFADPNTIYFTRQQSADGVKRDIYVYDLTDNNEESVITHPADDWYPAPSQQNDWLLFVSDREISGNDRSKIFKLDRNTKQVHAILASEMAYSSPWINPMQNEFLFTVKENGHYSMYQSDLNGDKMKPLSTRTIQFGAPKYSPDRERIVFFSDADNNFDIYELNLRTDELFRLTGHKSKDLSPNYSPNGDKIIFYSNRNGRYQIFQLHYDQPFIRQKLMDKLRLATK